MLLMTFSFSHLEIGPHFPLSAISHLGRVIAAHIMWVPTHPPSVLNLNLNPSRSSAKGLTYINVSQWIFLTPCERWEECSHFIDDLAKATAEIIFRARTQSQALSLTRSLSTTPQLPLVPRLTVGTTINNYGKTI